MQTRDPSQPIWPVRLAWLAVFIATSLLFSAVLRCAVPLVAFVAICALRQRRREALLSVAVIWLAVEGLGFTALHFPVEPSAFAWAAAVGGALLAATGAAASVARNTRGIARVVGTLLTAFCAYEGLLVAVTLAAGASLQAYTPTILLQVLALNGATFAGLLAVRALAAEARARHRLSAIKRA